VLLALDAVVVAAGAAWLREIPYAAFHTGYRKTALAPGEIVARVRLPRPLPGTVQAFRKVGTREAQAISKVVVALAGRIEDGRIADLRLAAGSVAATPVRLRAAEEAVRRMAPGPEAAGRAGRAAADAVSPIDDVRSTAEYRRFALERVVRRLVLGLGA
jgi:xanthine dehydrogenase small subunit